jgi:hypothetical protein
LPKAHQSSAEEDKARARAAIEGGQPAIDRLADESPSLLRDYFEDELLPAWADAYLVGRPDASLHQERAQLVGEALLRTTTDAMPRDAARALTEPVGASSQDPLRSQAVGYRSLREAKRLEDLQEHSCVQFRGAVRDLSAGGTAYASWATEELVSACLMESEHTKVLAQLDELAKVAEPRAYAQLLGHVRWLQALIHARRGELIESLDLYHSASVWFGRTRDVESQAVVSALTAENRDFLGERRGAWHDRRQGLAYLADVKNPRRREAILSEAVFSCLDERMPRSALYFETALVETALRWTRALIMSEALTRRAAIQHELGREDVAASDLREARQWILRIADKSLAERLRALADAAEGEILVRQQPEAAARSLGRSLAYFRTTSPALVPGLHSLLARAQLAGGFDDVAEIELLAGINALERARISLRDAALQVSFFDQALPLFDDMVRLQVTTRHDPERALAFVERSHARQLVDSMAGAAATPLEPEALRRALPDDVALIITFPSRTAFSPGH